MPEQKMHVRIIEPPKPGGRHYVTPDISVAPVAGAVAGPIKRGWWVSRRNTQAGGDIWLGAAHCSTFQEALAHARELAGLPQESNWQDKIVEDKPMHVKVSTERRFKESRWYPGQGELFTYDGQLYMSTKIVSCQGNFVHAVVLDGDNRGANVSISKKRRFHPFYGVVTIETEQS